jgi:ATP-dependent exoDNAse (exonuclease V) alpha subunit
MTLDDLVEWVDDAMERLPRGRDARRVRHIRRMYRLLDNEGSAWSVRGDWHALAVKIATLLEEPAPDEPSSPSKRERKRKPQPRAGGARGSRRGRRVAARPARAAIEVNPRLQAAFDAVAENRPIVFVTGGAGTGKSTFIRELRERFPEKGMVVLAPTGVAALNAGGQTIHSFCKLPLRPVMPEDAKKEEDPSLIEALDLMVIDEVSMVRADVLDGVDAFLRLNRKSPLPFGGVRMVLVGDLFQLPPVVTSRDAAAIAERYSSPYFFSAHCLEGLKFFPIELDVVYRQRDASFADMLARIRDGVGAVDAIRVLNERCVGRKLSGQHLVLVPTRKAAADENERRLAAVPGKPRVFDAKSDGSFTTAGEDRLPAPPRLVLKPGAQVMFVRNDTERRWVNGTLGTVKSLHTGRITVELEDGAEYDVEPIEWQDVRYALDEKTKTIVEEVGGTYVQFPLMPAWAVTIHKAQGLTLARVDVDLSRGAFAEGQVYVALSRCQTIDGLSLRRPIRAWEVRCSEAAQRFYEKIRGRLTRA